MSGIDVVQEYNQILKEKLLDGIHRGIIKSRPQPTMFGGKRMRNFVLPSSTEYDYPSSLSVGNLNESQPDMLGGSFWDDFGKGIKQGVTGVAKVAMPIVKEVGTELAKDAIKSYVKGSGKKSKKGGFLVDSNGKLQKQAEGEISGAGIFDTFKSGFKSVGNALAPIAKEIVQDVVVPEAKQMLKETIQKKTRGGKKFFSKKDVPLTAGNVLSDIGKVGQTVLPFLPLLMGLGRGEPLPPHPKKGGNFLDDLTKVSSAIAPFAPLLMAMGRGKPPSKIMMNRIIKCGGSFVDDLENVAQSVLPFGKMFGGNIVDDIGKEIAPFANLLKGLGRKCGSGYGAIRRHPVLEPDGGLSAFVPVVAKKKKGGVLIVDHPAEFQSNTSVMPPALSSYNPPKVSGGKKAKAPKVVGEKKKSARGSIVSQVMKEKGLKLAEASKYVKEHNLYKK